MFEERVFPVMSKDTKVIVFTTVARNYLSQASVLFRSIQKQCNNIDYYCFVTDGYDKDGEIPESLRSHVVDCRRLNISDFEEMAFRYSVTAFATALKPHLFNYVFGLDDNCRHAIFLDPDIKLYSDLNWVESSFGSKSILVTPHILKTDAYRSGYLGRKPNQDLTHYLRVGIYNTGFLALKPDVHGKDFINLLSGLLKDRCHFSIGSVDFCYEQAWIGLVSNFYAEQVGIVPNAGANVAYWNLHERSLTRDAVGDYYVNGDRLKFMHFSKMEKFFGTSPESRKKPNSLLENPEYSALYEVYADELASSGFLERRMIPYRYNYFDNGVPIDAWHRQVYSNLVKKEEVLEPFSERGELYKKLKYWKKAKNILGLFKRISAPRGEDARVGSHAR